MAQNYYIFSLYDSVYRYPGYLIVLSVGILVRHSMLHHPFIRAPDGIKIDPKIVLNKAF